MTMHESSYAIRQFHKNISQTTDILSFQRLFSDPKLDLTIHFESNLPWTLAWDVASDSLTGSCKITILPKLVINGELYEAPCKHDLVMPMDGFAGLEGAFLSALKDALGTAQRVWE
jgi:hypothetical protein